MTEWTHTDDALVGAACGYASKEIGGLKSPMAQTPYMLARAYCGASPDLFLGGAECGACYNITREGGPEGSAVVQIVNSNGMEDGTFNCHQSVFRNLTGANSGSFPIKYAPVACDTQGKGPVAVVFAGNAYYTKFVFSNLPHSLRGAELTVGERLVEMSRIGDTAQWSADHGKLSSTVGFNLVLSSGVNETLAGCFPVLPANGTVCEAPAAGAGNATGSSAGTILP